MAAASFRGEMQGNAFGYAYTFEWRVTLQERNYRPRRVDQFVGRVDA